VTTIINSMLQVKIILILKIILLNAVNNIMHIIEIIMVKCKGDFLQCI